MIFAKYLLIVFLLVLCGFFAGSETGVYRLSRLRLRIGADKGIRSYKILFKLVKDGQGLILSLLLGNNLVNYFLTSVVTLIILQRVTDHHWAEIYATAILTPVVFIFGELIPKNLFYYRADALLPRFAWAVWFFDGLFTYSGAKSVVRGVSTLISLCLRLPVDTAKAVDVTQRHQVQQIIHETREEGLLSEAQKEMMSRLIDVPTVSVGSVMIRLEDAEKVSVCSSRSDLLEHLKQSRFTRQLVLGDTPTDILGYISIFETLAEEQPFDTLRDHVVPLPQIDKNKSVIEAIDFIRNQKARIALVVESRKLKTYPVGLITLTDLIEEVIGELKS